MIRFIFILCVSFSFNSYAQEKKHDIIDLRFNYTHQFPFGDLSKRFGDNSSVGTSVIKKINKNRFLGINSGYIFGSKVKEDNLFDDISTNNSEIINKDGLFSNVLTYERGFYCFIIGGHAFLFKENNESGIYLIGGIGYMQHKIRIQTQEDVIPQLNDDYKKGYDRLSAGVSSKLEVNYNYFSQKSNVKWFIGAEIIRIWGKELRPYFFDNMEYSSSNLRNDILVGIKTGIIIPILKRNPSEYHYY